MEAEGAVTKEIIIYDTVAMLRTIDALFACTVCLSVLRDR